ncbi:MAG: LysR family transcriptional regulator [Pseudomonadales bacterium]
MKLNLRSIDLNLLTVFDAIMVERNLSRAAQKLGMTQSAASAALSRLRLTFDDELFIRTRQGMLPTPRAEELIRPIRDGLASIEEALSPSQYFDPRVWDRVFKMVLGISGRLCYCPDYWRHCRTSVAV